MPKIYKDFGFQPDFSSVPVRGMIDESIRPQLSEAANFVEWPWKTPQRTFRFRFTVDGAAEQRAFKLAMDANAGRFSDVYLPTWTRDFRVAANAASGANEIEIIESVAGYVADFLPDDREDTPGRIVWFWTPGQTEAHITRIVRVKASATPGQGVIEIEEGLPFAIDYQKDFYGWALVCRMLTDDIQYVYAGPSAFMLDLEFRQLRKHVDQERSLDLDEVAAPTATTEALVSIDLTIADAAGDYTVTHTKAAYCEGPATRTTVAHPYRTAWSAWSASGGIRIQQTAGPKWPPADADGALSGLANSGAIDTGHISFAFDNAAVEVLAIETTPQGPGEAFEVRHFDAGAQTRGPFSGFSPVLVYNAITMTPPTSYAVDTDVLCIYLKTNTNSLFCRIDRDDFATETELCELPAKLVRLLRAERDASDNSIKISGIDDGLRLVEINSAVYA